jgi:hypothetical protein
MIRFAVFYFCVLGIFSQSLSLLAMDSGGGHFSRPSKKAKTAEIEDQAPINILTEISSAVHACAYPTQLGLMVQSLRQKADRCRTMDCQKEKAITLSTLSKLLDDGLARQKSDRTYAKSAWEQRAQRLWQEYVAARVLIGDAPSEEERRQWHEATRAESVAVHSASSAMRCDDDGVDESAAKLRGCCFGKNKK